MLRTVVVVMKKTTNIMPIMLAVAGLAAFMAILLPAPGLYASKHRITDSIGRQSKVKLLLLVPIKVATQQQQQQQQMAFMIPENYTRFSVAKKMHLSVLLPAMAMIADQ